MLHRSPFPILLLAGLALLGVGGAAAVASASKRPPKKPPIPRLVTSTGEKVKAGRGSYCWRSPSSAHCADTIDPMRWAPRIAIRRGSTVRVHMRYPVERLSAVTRAGRKVRLRSFRGTRRKFQLIPPQATRKRDVGIYLAATYDRGDGLFAVHLGPRSRAVRSR